MTNDYENWVWVNPPKEWDKLDEALREVASHQTRKQSLIEGVRFEKLKQEIK